MTLRAAPGREESITIYWQRGRERAIGGYRFFPRPASAAFKTAATTRGTPMLVMQRKSIGHWRKKQGEQGAVDVNE